MIHLLSICLLRFPQPSDAVRPAVGRKRLLSVLSMMEVFCIGTSNKSQSEGYAAMGDCSNFAPIRTTVRGVHSLIARVNVLPECAQAFGA